MASEIGLGTLITPLLGLNLLPFVVGLAMMALLNRKRTKAWAGYAAAAFACYLVTEFQSEYFGSAAGQLLFSMSPWRVGVQVLAIVWMWHRAIVRRERLQIFAYLWVLIAYLPLARAPITAHGLYFMAPAWALWAACVVPDFQLALMSLWEKLKPKAQVVFAKLPNAA